MAMLAGLLIAAVVGLVAEPKRPRGLPEHPAVSEAFALVRDGVQVTSGELRYRAAILGGEGRDSTSVPGVAARLTHARALLERARREQPGDPRASAALGAIALAGHDHRRAEREFRRAVEAAPHYGEGRLGLGLALALRAEITPELWQARALRLQAVAQFAAVDPGDDAYAHATFDRALLLSRVGRAREGRRWAERYFTMDSTSAWAAALRREGLATR
jgi:tetratricopeptide (TPR) repeat protein